MTAPLFTVAGLVALPLSADDAAAARELFEACDGSDDLTCGLPVGSAGDPGSGGGSDLRIGVFEGPDTAGVIEAVRDAPAPGWWTIGLLMVETGRRGATLGRDVLDAFAAWATDQGAAGLVVGVPRGPGEVFWRSAGFSEASPDDRRVPSAPTGAGIVELRRVLGTSSSG